jgi:hypothetical protein
MYLLYKNEYRVLKPVEITIRSTKEKNRKVERRRI